MSSNSDYNAMMRQWAILNHLPKRPPGITASELQVKLVEMGFNVTKRTVERDLNDLFRFFQFQCNDKGKPYGWYWDEGRGITIPGLSIAEALSLRLLKDFLKPLLPKAILTGIEPQFRQAEEILKTLESTNQFATWQHKVSYVAPGLNLLPPAIDMAILDTIQTALLQENILEVVYQGTHDAQEKHFRLHPLGMIQRGSVTYLAATAFDYQDVRLYAVHRFKQADRSEEAAHRPEQFNLQHYVEDGALNFGNAEPFSLDAFVKPTLANYLHETPLSMDQRLDAEGEGYRLTATVNDSWQLRWWVLSQGPQIVIHQPESFRNQIVALLQQAAQQYG